MKRAPETPARRRSEGSCQRIGQDKYQIRVSAGKDERGKRITRAKVVHGTRREARAELELLKHAAKQSPRAAAAPVRSLDDLAEGWWRRAPAERTQRGYRDTYRKHIAPFFGGASAVASITLARVESFLAHLNKTRLSRRTQHHIFSNLRALLNYATKHDALKRNPCARVTAPKVPQSEPKGVLTTEQIAALWQGARDASDPHWLLVAVLATAGLRPAEARALQWSSLHRGGDGVWRLTIAHAFSRSLQGPAQRKGTKTGRGRALALPPAVADALQEARGTAAADAFIFSRAADRGALSERDVIGAVRIAGARIDWPTLTPYSLRHSHATALVSAGHSLPAISHRLGHQRISTTLDRYCHARPAEDAELAAHFSPVGAGGSGSGADTHA